MDAEGGHERLSRPGRRRDEHGVAGLEGLHGLELELVEGEGQVGLEFGRAARFADGPRGCGQRPSSFPMPMERK